MTVERFRWLRTKLRRIFRRGKQESELDAEMQFHFDQLVEEFEVSGMNKREATAAAHREFGTTDSYREEVRDSWRPIAMADLWRSVLFAFRSLARTPGFTIVAIVTLALGIGANTSMFSVVNGVVFKPLPYPESERMDRIYRTTTSDPAGGVAPLDLAHLGEETKAYGEIASYTYASMSLSELNQPAEMADGIRVSTNFFRVFATQPQLGRAFHAHEEIAGNHRVLVISNRMWRNRFGSRADIIGHSIRINGEPNEIIGVMPESFNDWRYMGWVDIFRPLGLSAEEKVDHDQSILHLVGRRASDVSAAEGAQLIAGFGDRLAQDFPAVNAETGWRTLSLDVLKAGEGAQLTLTMLVGLSGFVLLIACSNLANLLLARTMSRAREFAVRAALGASRRQLIRPLAIESLVLALAGGVGAIFVALVAHRWLAVRSTGDSGEQVIFTLDWSVMAWAGAASLITAIAFGIAPALFALRLNLNQALKTGSRGTTGNRQQQKLRNLLIIGQFALAMVLLTGASLFIRGLNDLNNRRGGWESDGLVTGTFLLPEAGYPTTEDITAFQRLALEKLETIPGVDSVSFSHAQPFLTWFSTRRLWVEGLDTPEPGHEPTALFNGVTPDYFQTVQTPLLSGRAFSDQDTADSPPVYIISESTARGLFGDLNPIGRRLSSNPGNEAEWGEIVGVAADVKSIFPEATPVTFQLYRPMAQSAQHNNQLAVRTTGVAPTAVVDGIRNIMTEMDRDLPLNQLQPANATIARANYQLGVLRDMLISFAILGLALAALGIYSVIARTVALRTGEFGIRLALGAQVKDIIRLVLSSGTRLAFYGAALGLIGAFGISQLLSFSFPNMALDQGPVLVITTLILVGVALIASYLPARRASKISPTEALRAE
ncbi:MAG: ABC transporter permease [Synoicihabitans sp.]